MGRQPDARSGTKSTQRPTPGMQWEDARILLAVLRASSMSHAATQLALDRSTISRRLTALEHALDARLFVRARDGLRPTAVAQRLRPHAERAEAEMLALQRVAAGSATRVAGTVRLAATEAFAPVLVAEGVLELRREHPELSIEILAGNRPLDLARGEADLALRVARPREATLRARRLARMGIGLFAAPAYLAERAAIRAPADLAGHDVLLPSAELERLPEAAWLAARPGVRVALRSNSMSALRAAAVSAYGVVPLPLGWGDAEPGLRRVLVLDGIPERTIWLVYDERVGERPAVRVVATHLAAVLARVFAPARAQSR